MHAPVMGWAQIREATNMNIKTILTASAAALALAALPATLCAQPVQAYAAQDGTGTDTGTVTPTPTPTPSKLKGWQNNKTCYYKNGFKVTGIQKIGKAHYFFTAKGKLKKNTFKSGGVTYYANAKGKLEAYKKGSTFYKPTGVKMAKYSAREYQSLLYARKYLKQIVKKSDSMATKRYKCMKWINHGYYEQYRNFKNVAGWTSTYANDHFVKRVNGFRYGDCVSDPSAFAYLCLAAGFKSVAVCVDEVNKYAHAYAYINGKYYDPLFAEAKSWSKYYGYTGAYWATKCVLKIPSYKNGYTTSSYVGKKPSGLSKTTSSSSSNSGETGLVTKSGALYYYKNGKKVTSKWVTVKKATYYFGSNGKAVSGSVKIKKNGTKAYYVFNAKHKLLTGSATRVVTVSGVKYRVSKTGKAVSGWVTDGTAKHCYLENGAFATGPCLVGGKLLVFEANGDYNEEKSTQAQALVVREAAVGNLIELLGTPRKTTDAESCNILKKTTEDGVILNMEGTDRTYVYEHLKMVTFVANRTDGDGGEYFMSIS